MQNVYISTSESASIVLHLRDLENKSAIDLGGFVRVHRNGPQMNASYKFKPIATADQGIYTAHGEQ